MSSIISTSECKPSQNTSVCEYLLPSLKDNLCHIVIVLYCFKIRQNPVSSVGTSRHTIACMTYPKSTSRRCSPLFRFLAPLSSGQKRSSPKTQCGESPQTGIPSDRSSSYGLSAPSVCRCGMLALPLLVFLIPPPSRIVCRIELNPMLRVGMLDVAACVLSNPLTFLRGIQSLWMFYQI